MHMWGPYSSWQLMVVSSPIRAFQTGISVHDKTACTSRVRIVQVPNGKRHSYLFCVPQQQRNGVLNGSRRIGFLQWRDM